jgi:DNA-directed RNA polymerase specialized sigma24 family protein
LVNARVDAVDASGVAELFRVWRLPMARLAYVLTGDASRADEIVQDAFLKVHARWARIDNPIAYLRTAVVNGCRSHHRRAAIERRRPPEPVGVAYLGADELSDALATLHHRYRAVLALKYFCDLADDEVAEILHVRPATVRTRQRRALAQLRKELQP